MRAEMVVVKIFSNETEAIIAKGLLESEGIIALIRKDDVGGMLPPLQQAMGVKLLVDRQDKDKALSILEEI